MAIRRVRIENFRSIRSCEFYPTSLCSLVGENNAGKSNILRALNLVLGRDYVNVNAFTRDDHWNHDPANDIVIEVELDPPISHQPFKYGPPTEIAILRYTLTHYKVNTKRGNKGDPRLETHCLTSDGKPAMVPTEAPKAGKQLAFVPMTNIPSEVRYQLPLIFIGTDRRLASQLPSSGRNSLLWRLLSDVNDRLKETTITTTSDTGEDIERSAIDLFEEQLDTALQTLRIPEFQRLEQLLRTHSLENLGFAPETDAERMRFNFGLFDSMAFYRAIRLLFNEAGTEMDATAMGEGAQNALVLAIFQAYEALRKRGATFLIEEPEMYLHPHRRRFFYQTLERIAERNQVIYTTHSANFVSVPDYENVRLVFRDKEETTKVRASTLKADTTRREKLRQELDPERNELFFARHVLLVEGDTEKLALPEYAKRLNLNLDRLGVSVVEVGGKRSLPGFIDVVSSFGIRVTIVFDTDSSDFGKSQADAEEKFNDDLRARESARIRVVELDPKYEKILRAELGDELYENLCQKYPGHSKPRRARLIATDESAPIPNFAKKIFAPFSSETL